MSAKKKPARPARARASQAAATVVSSELTAAIAAINKVHGEGTVARGDRLPPALHSPTGIFPLDLALCGGLAEGFAASFYGFESAGKTAVMLKAIAGYQRKYPDRICAFVDAEKLYDELWAEKLGVDLPRLQVVTPDTGEQAIDAVQSLMSVDVLGMLALDSIPALVPKTIDDRSAEDKTMGALAALCGVLNSKVLTSWGRERKRGHRVSFLYSNQWRYKLGTFTLGDGKTLPGGRQINHLPTTKLGLTRVFKQTRTAKEEKETDDTDETTAVRHVTLSKDLAFKVEKRKHGTSIDQGEFTLITGEGHPSGLSGGDIDDAKSVAIYAQKFGLLTGSGGHYAIPGFHKEGFARKEEILAWLRTRSREVLLLRAAVIATMRKRQRLPAFPPDDSLEGLHGVSKLMPVAI